MSSSSTNNPAGIYIIISFCIWKNDTLKFPLCIPKGQLWRRDQLTKKSKWTAIITIWPSIFSKIKIVKYDETHWHNKIWYNSKDFMLKPKRQNIYEIHVQATYFSRWTLTKKNDTRIKLLLKNIGIFNNKRSRNILR